MLRVREIIVVGNPNLFPAISTFWRKIDAKTESLDNRRATGLDDAGTADDWSPIGCSRQPPVSYIPISGFWLSSRLSIS